MGRGLNRHPWEYNNELLRAGVAKTVVGGAAQALTWYQAARRQRRRIWSKREKNPLAKAVDGHHYAIALVHAMRGADMVRKHTRDTKLDAAMQQLEKRAPGYRDVRDLLEHWDAYARGKGKLQQTGEVPRKPTFGRRWTRDHVTDALDYTITVGPFALSLETSFDALRDVVRATCAVADRLHAKKRAGGQKQRA